MDHILTNWHCVDNISSIMCIHSPDNFSDHVPVFFELNVSLPHVGSSDTISSHGNTSLHDKINWRIIDSASREAYKICVRASLPTLSDELQDCSTPGFKNMRDITSNFRNKLSTVLNSFEEDVASFSFL